MHACKKIHLLELDHSLEGRDEMAQQSGKHRSQQFSIIIGVESEEQEETEKFVREGARPTLYVFTQYVGSGTDIQTVRT